MASATPFTDLNTLAAHLRQELEDKDFILLYAYNGVGNPELISIESATEMNDVP